MIMGMVTMYSAGFVPEPGEAQPQWTLNATPWPPAPLTEAEIRRIVREELERLEEERPRPRFRRYRGR